MKFQIKLDTSFIDSVKQKSNFQMKNYEFKYLVRQKGKKKKYKNMYKIFFLWQLPEK